ncbi:MAG: thrombospondin type 3 repeat-containing protein, partial [Candidatus Hermodarchaeota archaeon]
IHFTDPTNPDTDGDGYMDGIEVLWGSNPLDAKITLNTVFFNIAGIVLLLSTGYYTVRTQLYKKKHDVKEKIPKAKFSIGKKSEIYNALTVTKQEKPKQVVPYKKSPYSVPYTQPTTKTTSLNINQLKNTILYHLPPPKTSNSTEGKRALTMANYAFKLFSQGRYQESILNMLKALMLGVPEPTNSRLKIIILDSLNRIEDSIRSLTSYTSPTIGETHLTKSCVFCGTLNKITNKFCTECGRAL